MLRARIVTCGLLTIFMVSGVVSLSACSTLELSAKRSPKAKKARPKAPKDPVFVPKEPGFTVPEDDAWSDAWTEVKPPLDPYVKAHSAGLNGVVNNFGSGYGLEYIHTENYWLDYGLALRRTRASLDKEELTGANEYIEADTNALRFLARYVQYKWLYAAATLDYSRINGDYGWKGTAIAAGDLTTEFDAQFAAIGLLAGSQWEGPWGSYFGVDWIGFSAPVFGSVEVTSSSDLDLTTRLLTGDEVKKRLKDETTAQLQFSYLNLRVGWHF